jgi:hypothetical protein
VDRAVARPRSLLKTTQKKHLFIGTSKTNGTLFAPLSINTLLTALFCGFDEMKMVFETNKN